MHLTIPRRRAPRHRAPVCRSCRRLAALQYVRLADGARVRVCGGCAPVTVAR